MSLLKVDHSPTISSFYYALGMGKWECRMAKLRKTQDEFENEILENGNGEYVVLGKYLGSSKKVRLFHKVCKKEWEVRPNSFLSNGKRCFHCFGNKTKSHINFTNEVENLYKNQYRVVSEYKNTREEVEIQHVVCGNTFSMNPTIFLRCGKCPHCFKIGRGKKLSQDEFCQRMNEMYNGEIIPLDEYVTHDTKIMFKHVNCGHEWKAAPENLLYKDDFCCPNCRSLRKVSKGEDKIIKYLNLHKVRYSHQFTISDCKNQNLLRFDFCVFDNKNSIMFIVEFDGRQHYESIEFFGGEEYLEHMRQNDSIKNEYCQTNNIKLIRIPYWDFNRIEEILHKELIKK